MLPPTSIIPGMSQAVLNEVVLCAEVANNKEQKSKRQEATALLFEKAFVLSSNLHPISYQAII